MMSIAFKDVPDATLGHGDIFIPVLEPSGAAAKFGGELDHTRGFDGFLSAVRANVFGEKRCRIETKCNDQSPSFLFQRARIARILIGGEQHVPLIGGQPSE